MSTRREARADETAPCVSASESSASFAFGMTMPSGTSTSTTFTTLRRKRAGRGALAVKHLGDGQLVVHERELDVLARTVVRNGKDHRVRLVHQPAQAREELLRAASHLGALDRQLGVHRPAQAHERDVRHALPRAEVQLRRGRVQPLERDVRALRPRGNVVVGAHGIVEKRARLHQDG